LSAPIAISEQRVAELTNRKDFPKPTDVLAAATSGSAKKSKPGSTNTAT